MNTTTYAIIGATGGIGAELGRMLAATGARLALAARTETKLHDLADDLRRRGASEVMTQPLDQPGGFYE